MALTKTTTENPELAARFNRVLERTVEALEETRIQYVFIGGVASGGLGRPRSTHDIDVFVRPEDAEIALRALARHGFRTERTDPVWLYKGFKEGILVDIIFKSKGEIFLDPEMYRRATTAEFHGKRLKLVSPEDLIIIKAVAHSELTPSHWHDALALMTHAEIDWPYLIRRARRAPRRVLSLLLYAHSTDISVPTRSIEELFRLVYGCEVVSEAPRASGLPNLRAVGRPLPELGHGVARLRERLAEDPRTHELDVRCELAGSSVLLRGQVLTSERLRAVEDLAREVLPGTQIVNQLGLVELPEPRESEKIA
jgi:predicted nucleotidyltransferase